VWVEISEQERPDGRVIEASMSSGESYRIGSDATGANTACSFRFPVDRTSWSARREGDTLRIEGTVQGRPVSRTVAIDGNPWHESAERSLQSYAVSGSGEPVEVNGRVVEAVRVTVRPAGILAFTWSSMYWYDPRDGTFLRSRCVRGFLSLVPTVMELVEDRRPGR
jgi:hypothetical protein